MIPLVCHNLYKQRRFNMPKNKIQLQKGLRLPQFLKLYGTEDACRSRLLQVRWPQGFSCPQCGGKRHYTVTTRNLYQCTECKYQCSLISGTIFENTKLPLTTWFLAIYFVTQSKGGLSALHLRRLLGISVNAAFKMKQKIQHVMKSADDSLLLDNLVELDDVYWGGKKNWKTWSRSSRKNTIPCCSLP